MDIKTTSTNNIGATAQAGVDNIFLKIFINTKFNNNLKHLQMLKNKTMAKLDIDKFIELYPNTPNDELARMFGVAEATIPTKASRLGVKKTLEFKRAKQYFGNGKSWEEDEVEFLQDNWNVYSDRELEQLLPNRSVNSIVTKRMQLGLRRNTKMKKRLTKQQKKLQQEILKRKEYIQRNEIAVQNTRQMIDNLLNNYGITEKISDKIR